MCSPDPSSDSGENDARIPKSFLSKSGEGGERMPNVFCLSEGGGESTDDSEFFLGSSIVTTASCRPVGRERCKGRGFATRCKAQPERFICFGVYF